MKYFALFLPQFYETEENNKWWGKGFTEWKNVKAAQPLYINHMQPKIPLNDNYYNMLDKETMKWQTELMHDYGIDAFIYYHYYFKGYKLLEKPAENLLKWKDINQTFFFNWANHSWIRSWNGSKEILIEQTYGNEMDWREHFNYLLRFFNDKRYLKIDNMPVLIIYNSDFEEKEEMFSMFDLWCKEKGFKGLYLIEECIGLTKKAIKRFEKNLCSISKNVYYSMPAIGRNIYQNKSIFYNYKEALRVRFVDRGIIKKVKRYSGDELLLSGMCEKVKNSIPGLFFSWDNTPRHGYRGYIIDDISFEAFTKYMNYYKNSDYMIINAWNEWCEGMILEPTEENGYKFLSWLKDIKR